MTALVVNGELTGQVTDLRSAVAVMYLAMLKYHGGGMASAAEVDKAVADVAEWGRGVPDAETWGRGGSRGGQAAIKDALV